MLFALLDLDKSPRAESFHPVRPTQLNGDDDGIVTKVTRKIRIHRHGRNTCNTHQGRLQLQKSDRTAPKCACSSTVVDSL